MGCLGYRGRNSDLLGLNGLLGFFLGLKRGRGQQLGLGRDFLDCSDFLLRSFFELWPFVGEGWFVGLVDYC